MALSPEEKERRRLAQNERNRAYHARCAARRKAEEAGKAEIDAKILPELEPAQLTEDAILAERNREIEDIRQQISILESQIDAARRIYGNRYEVARAVTKEIWDRKNAALSELAAKLDAEFPDLCGSARWSAAAWKGCQP